MTNTLKTLVLMAAMVVLTVTANAQGFYNPYTLASGGYYNAQSQSSSNGYSNTYSIPGGYGQSWGSSSQSSYSANWGSYAQPVAQQPFVCGTRGGYRNGGYYNAQSAQRSSGYNNNYAIPGGYGQSWGSASQSSYSANWGNYGGYTEPLVCIW
ncbi:MAG: hypothetical protein GHCLOJNM_02276 [bacterium]|nr:hypothetical protein [bacterium]